MSTTSTKPSVKIVKTMPYEGGTRQWSNRYFFTGHVPAGSADWIELMDQVTAAEKQIYKSTLSIVNAVGYLAGSDVPVFSKAYSLAGTFSPGTATEVPGDCAAICKWSTDQRTSKNHPIYLFKYWHGALKDSGGGGDALYSTQKTQMHAYGANWVTGFTSGGVAVALCGPRGAVGTTPIVEDYIRHRDFPR